MPLILLFIFSSLSFAGQVCVQENLSHQCMAELCQFETPPRIPLTPAAFEMELANYNFVMPETKLAALNEYFPLTESVRSKAATFTATINPEAVADEILGNLVKYKKSLELMAEDKIAISMGSAENSTVIVSDVETMNREAYKRLASLLNDLESDNLVQAGLPERFAANRPDIILAITDFKKTIAEMGVYRNTRDMITRSCKLASYVQSKTVGRNLTEEQEQSKRKTLNGIKNNYLPKLSDESKEYILQKLNEDPFEEVELKEDIYPDFAQLKNTVQPYNAVPFTQTSYLEYISATAGENEARMCSSEVFLPSDYYFNGKVTTSYFSLVMGYSDVLSHEMGHWISEVMKDSDVSTHSKLKFMTLRHCLNGFYTNSPRVMFADHFGDRYTTEEDFADWFDALINSTERTRADCDMHSLLPNITNYLYGISSPIANDLYSREVDDTHSTELFRVLHMNLNKGFAIPVSCQTLMDQNPEQRPRACSL